MATRVSRPAGERVDRARQLGAPVLAAAWGVAAAVSFLTVPAYRGDWDGRVVALVPVAIIAVLAALVLRASAPSRTAALASAVAPLGALALAAATAVVIDPTGDEARGEPLLLYAGIALWLSWAGLVLASALLTRTRWTAIGPLALTAAIALFGWLLVTFQID